MALAAAIVPECPLKADLDRPNYKLILFFYLLDRSCLCSHGGSWCPGMHTWMEQWLEYLIEFVLIILSIS